MPWESSARWQRNVRACRSWVRATCRRRPGDEVGPSCRPQRFIALAMDETSLDDLKPAATWRHGSDDRRLRRGRGEGGLRGARHRRIPRSRDDHACPGPRPAFPRSPRRRSAQGAASAGIVKDAGDDPDVTHGALVVAAVRRAPPGSGVTLRAGPGVGTVTRPGLPLAVGEPAINPGPRAMIGRRSRRSRRRSARRSTSTSTISIPGGEALAGEDPERAARHRRRPVDPRHDRHRRAVFLRGLDPFDPSRHRRRARGRARRMSPARPARPRKRRCSAPRSARDRADRHGRFRRRDAEISARATRSAHHHGRRLRQDGEAGARPPRPAFRAGAVDLRFLAETAASGT